MIDMLYIYTFIHTHLYIEWIYIYIEQKILTVEDLRWNILCKNGFSISWLWLPYIYFIYIIWKQFVYIYLVYVMTAKKLLL